MRECVASILESLVSMSRRCGAPSVAVAMLLAAGCNGSNRAVIASFALNLLAQARLVNESPGLSDSDDPEICCDGLNVYIVWEDDRNAVGGNRDIYFNFSRDGGVTWQPNDIRLDTDPPGSGDSDDPLICCSGSNIYVVWRDERTTPGIDDIYFNSSSDGGVTWQANDIRLDTDPLGSANSDRARICCSGQRVYVAWEDDRNSTEEDIFFNYSDDGGATWQANDRRIDTEPPALADSENIALCCDGLNVYAAWQNNRDGEEDIYFNVSTDGGASWRANDIRIDSGDAAGGAQSRFVALCCDGPRVYAVWEDERNAPGGNNDILCNYSFDSGATWQPNAIQVDNGSGDAEEVAVCCEGLNVYVVWRDQRTGGFNNDVFFNCSRDGGLTWKANDIRLDVGDPAGSTQAGQARICCAGSLLFAVWTDARNGASDIFCNLSTDSGDTWQANDVRLDTGDAPGANDSAQPVVCCHGPRVYFAWFDRRNDAVNRDIYFNGSR